MKRRTGEMMRRRKGETREMTNRSIEQSCRQLCSFHFFRNILHVPRPNPKGGLLPWEYIHTLLKFMCEVANHIKFSLT